MRLDHVLTYFNLRMSGIDTHAGVFSKSSGGGFSVIGKVSAMLMVPQVRMKERSQLSSISDCHERS